MIDSELASGSSNAQVFESFYQARNCAGIPNVWFLTVILLTVRVDNLITLLEEFREQELPKGLPLSDSENVFQNEVTAVLEDHLSDPDFSVNMLAEQISISRRQLLRKCKRNFDQLPNKYARWRLASRLIRLRIRTFRR